MSSKRTTGSEGRAKEVRAGAQQLSFLDTATPVNPAMEDADKKLAAEQIAKATHPVETVLSVGQLVRAARLLLETRFAEVRVEGEISGLRVSGPGHVYFTLKDREAQLDCALFAREAARQKWKPSDGLRVVCRGRLTIFEGRGKFQLSVTEILPDGAGALALAFEALKERLANEGLFDSKRKRPLPFLPRQVGVVTSRTGSVIRDIIHVAHRRARIPILVSDTPVQGQGAALHIVRALERLWEVPTVDVIILARGGGSLEDLWAFNEEVVARAIVRSPVPVVSAIGHETDFTIADFTADVRAPTPSAAAEIVFPDFASLLLDLKNTRQRLARAITAELARARHDLARVRTGFEDPRRLIDRRRQWLDELTQEAGAHLRRAIRHRRESLLDEERRLLGAHPQRRIGSQRRALVALGERLRNAGTGALATRRRDFERASAKLDALSPLSVLGRGYSLAQHSDGRVIRKASAVVPGEQVRVTVHEGAFVAAVLADSGTTPGQKAKKA